MYSQHVSYAGGTRVITLRQNREEGVVYDMAPDNSRETGEQFRNKLQSCVCTGSGSCIDRDHSRGVMNALAVESPTHSRTRGFASPISPPRRLLESR
jgi:hypothetical protein